MVRMPSCPLPLPFHKLWPSSNSTRHSTAHKAKSLTAKTHGNACKFHGNTFGLRDEESIRLVVFSVYDEALVIHFPLVSSLLMLLLDIDIDFTGAAVRPVEMTG